MKPVLIVEGVRHDVFQLGFQNGEVSDVTIFTEDSCKMFQNAKLNKIYLEGQSVLDFDEALKWEGQYDETIVAIEKRIEAHEERLIELAQEFIAIHVDEELPFPEVVGKRLRAEYIEIMARLNGLYEAKEIALELEGGENNEQ